MAWKFDNGSSISMQIASRLREGIVSGEYKPGAQFPTVRQLSNDISVNPNTVQKALSMLEGENLIYTESTNGKYVTTDEGLIALAREKMAEEKIGRIISLAKSFSINKEELMEYIEKGWDNYE